MPPFSNLRTGRGFLPLLARGASGGVGNDLIRFRLAPSDGERQFTRLPGKQALFAITLVLVALAVYILLIDVLGYIVDTFLFVVFLVKVVEREPWPLTLKLAVAATAGIFITFHILLKITLPSNMFGFLDFGR